MCDTFTENPDARSLEYVMSTVHMEYSVDSIIQQLKDAMRKGYSELTFRCMDRITNMADMQDGDIHTMQASRLHALGWTVERHLNCYKISGWAIPLGY